MGEGQAPKQVCVFGAGRIGAAVAHGLLAGGHPRDRLLVTTRSGRPTTRTEGLRLATNADAATVADVALICPKPQDARALLDEIANLLDPGAVVVSFVSGLTTSWFERQLAAGTPVVRVMTTLAIEAGQGATVISAGRQATTAQVDGVARLLSATGTTTQAPEEYLDAVSAVAGGGIAYVYFLVEAMTQAGVAVGLPNELARDLLTQAVIGAGAMMRETGRHPVQLREDVMSRGGQTIAGFRELERHNVRTALFDAVESARDRGVTLAAEIEKSS